MQCHEIKQYNLTLGLRQVHSIGSGRNSTQTYEID